MNSPQTQNPPNPEHASLMADMFLGAANNIIEVGSGFFVRLNPSAEMQEYDELIQVIDQQNEQNIHRLKLDESDRAMIRPLLAAVLAKRGAVLSAEHQLAIAFFSILIKKAQVILQIRNENQILAERIRMIIREAKEEENSPAVDFQPAPVPESEEELQMEEEEALSHTEGSTEQEPDSSPIGKETSQEAPVIEHQDKSEAQEYNDSMQALRRAREEELERRKAAREPIIQEEVRSTPEPGDKRTETRSERRRREREEKKQKRNQSATSPKPQNDES